MFLRSFGNILGIGMPGLFHYLEGMKERVEQNRTYTTTQVCAALHVTRKTLFYYDRIGLLKPLEHQVNSKLYSEEQIGTLKHILTYRDAGLSIQEIRTLLEEGSDQKLVMENAMRRLQEEEARLQRQMVNLKTLMQLQNNHP